MNDATALAARRLGLEVSTLQRQLQHHQAHVGAAALSTAQSASRATAAFFRSVSGGWTPSTHCLYPSSAREAVRTVMLVQHRLENTRVTVASDGCAGGASAGSRMPSATAPEATAGIATPLACILFKKNLAELWIRCILKFMMFEGWPITV